MSKHTQGPWVVRDGDEDGRVSIVGSSQIVLATVRTVTVEPGEENARRIVACVNACEGIDTEELEIIADDEKTLKMCFDRITKQRDKLVEALEEIKWMRPLGERESHYSFSVENTAIEALASVKGETT